MRIVLTRPEHRTHLHQPPLALGYLAAVLRREGHEVRVVDGLLERLSPARLARRCRGAELVGISWLSDYSPQVLALSRALRSLGIPLVLGGPHPTILPRESLALTGAQFVVRGEGEQALPRLAAALSRGASGADIPSVGTPDAPQPAQLAAAVDLDQLPFPDWSDCPPARYPPAPHGGVARNYPVAPVASSRGCPYDCSFCASPRLWDRTIRFRAAENVVEEMAQLVQRYGVREVHFEDDNLTLRRDHVTAIAEEILRRGLRLSWATPNGVRADTLDRPLLRLMRRSGCYSVAFGIESADAEVLRRTGKRTSLDQIEHAIDAASQEGLITQGFFIFGLPGETPESMERTIRFASRSRLDKAQFLLLDVMPGSRLWGQHGSAAAAPGSFQSFHDVSWCPDGLAPSQLRRAQRRAFLRFFASPRRLVRVGRMVRPAQLRYVLRRLLDFRVLPGRR